MSNCNEIEDMMTLTVHLGQLAGTAEQFPVLTDELIDGVPKVLLHSGLCLCYKYAS
jgi:hypothetical protein